ncbi:hypothetical protein SLEP1_g24892 [Rubroshorea leprosula]|uniref:Mechanosensitive ion channel MscS domain-containing protein n=1 Tax=Rubroshorea leprosula TaxID=152421 RepID=A0AAV5JNA0_9ROSI|nr:hypothetical protein SLEP1_g24892 [Rubroshorea leprosula]
MARKNETNDAVIQVEDQGAISSPGDDVQGGRSSPPQQPDEENSQPAEKGTAKDDETSPHDGEKRRGKRAPFATTRTVLQNHTPPFRLLDTNPTTHPALAHHRWEEGNCFLKNTEQRFHPFDIEDHCFINGEEMIVEGITLLTTVFCKNGKDKIFYPNSVLTTLPIKNCYRGVVDMDYSVEFSIDNSITNEQVENLKSQIKVFLENDPKSWLPEFRIVHKEIEDGKMKMVLCVSCCNINLKDHEETMSERRSELVDKLRNVFTHDIKIKYYDIRPQEVDLLRSSSRRRLDESRSFLLPR